MKINSVIFSCLFLFILPLKMVSAAEADVLPEQAVVDQPVVDHAEDEMTAAETSAFSKSLFEGRCQMCHQLPEPGMLRPKQWRLILGTMQQRMQQAGVPPLTEVETERLLEYLAAQARE